MAEKEAGDFCFLANIQTYLESFGKEYEEFWIGGITGVMGFYFTTKGAGVPSVIHGRSEEFEGLYASFMEYVKSPIEVEHFSEAIETVKRLQELLDEGITPMIWMDEFYLEGAYNYQKNHLWVMAVIRKVTEKEIFLFNNEEMKVNCNALDDLLKRNGVIELSYTKMKEILFYTSDLELVILGLKKVIKNLKKVSESCEEFYGIQGMQEFAKSFEECRDYEKIYEYFFELNRGGGLYKTRRNMRLFLEKIESRWQVEEIQPCVSVYAELEESWTKITNLLFKLSVCKDLALQNRITKRIQRVILLEEEGRKKLEMLCLVLSNKAGEGEKNDTNYYSS